MAKCIRDGKVAIIFSFDDRWSTMNMDSRFDEFLLHDSGLVDLIESQRFDEIPAFVEAMIPDADFSHSQRISVCKSLEIKWVPVCSKFRITTIWDGTREWVETFDPSQWKTA